MKKWLLCIIGLGALLLILGGALILNFYGRSFLISQTSSETLTLELPIQRVAINLLMSDVSSKISQRLGIEILEKKTIEKRGDLSLSAVLSGKWNARQVEESSCQIRDNDLGTLLLKIRAATDASPQKVVTTTELSEGVGILEDMVQVVTIIPVVEPGQESEKPTGKGLIGIVSSLMGNGKQSGKTEIMVEYTTSIRVDYPELPLIRAEAEKRLARSHEKTMRVLVDTLREFATNPDMMQLEEK